MSGFVEDRSMSVRPSQVVRTQWVHVNSCILGNRERMDFAAIERKGQQLLQQGDCGSWPPPNGQWQDDRFVIYDGRHEFLAHLALGRSHIFVAWLEESPAP